MCANQIKNNVVKNVKTDDMMNLLNQWNISYHQTLAQYDITGSPERTLFRTVVGDSTGEKYILEMIPQNKKDHKVYISQVLQKLKDTQMPYIYPYLKTKTNEYFAIENEMYWQLRPYIVGIPLDRSQYFKDAWRGKKTASFLANLKTKATNLDLALFKHSFSLKKYVLDMISTMKHHNPNELQKVQSILSYLKEGFFQIYDSIPLCFCHGDVHVLNIIWSEDDIRCIIDWEFCGIKIELYDIANFLGCIGIEHPMGLVQNISLSFINEIYENNLISSKGSIYLIDCMIALRFAWLAEWFRKQDHEMISLEITYMNLIMNQKKFIAQKWNESIGEENYF